MNKVNNIRNTSYGVIFLLPLHCYKINQLYIFGAHFKNASIIS